MYEKLVMGAIACCVLFHGIDAASNTVQYSEIKEHAQSYFSQGEALFEKGEYTAAADAFLRAYEIMPHHAVLANIGLAYERAGQYPTAVNYFKKYLIELEMAQTGNPRIEAILRRTLAQVAEITVSTDGFPKRCRIYVDHKDMGDAPVQMVVFPGEHDIQVVSDGKILATERVAVLPGETRRFTLSGISPPKPKAEAIKKETDLRVPFWIATASTAGTAVASGILWGATFKTKRAFDGTDDISEKARLKRNGEAYQLGAAITSGVAGVGMLTTAVLGIIRIATSKENENMVIQANVSRDLIGMSVFF